MPPQYRIGVSGFGIAGGAVAALLARAGHAVTIFERAPAVGPVGTGLLLQVSGQIVLDRLGVLEQVTTASEPLRGLHVFYPNGKTLVRLDYANALNGKHGYGVHRGVLFEAIRGEAASAGATIVLNAEIVDWRIDGNEIYSRSSTASEYGPFDFLIGADGSKSQIRARLAPNIPSTEYPFGAIWYSGRNSRVRGYLHQVVSGTEKLLGLLPVGDDRCTLFYGLKNSMCDALRAQGIDAWKKDVLDHCPLAEETVQAIHSFDDVVFTTYRRAKMITKHHQHVICLGDASHPMSPHLGQGANLALLDAMHFSDALQASNSFDDACDIYRKSRQSAIKYYAGLSWALTPFFQSEYRILSIGRGIALPLMAGIPPIKREMVRAMGGVKNGLLRSLPEETQPAIVTS